jgi:hypothetical protein
VVETIPSAYRDFATMRRPDPGEKPAVKTTILEDDAAAELWAREKEGKAGSGTWT